MIKVLNFPAQCDWKTNVVAVHYNCVWLNPRNVMIGIGNERGASASVTNKHQNINSLRPRLNRRPFADDIFNCIFLNENEWILPRISLKFVPRVRINNIPALVQIMAWRRPGDKPLSEPMMVSLLTHICVTRPQWVKSLTHKRCNCIAKRVAVAHRHPGYFL